MSTKPYPALCRDCKHSKPERDSTWNLRCTHPKVNGADPWALSSGIEGHGSDCRSERQRNAFVWFAKCGMKGKLWEAVDSDA